MISWTIIFHLGSAVGILVAVVALARRRAQVRFLRRWASPPTAGLLVDEPLHALKLFCDAYGIAMSEESTQSKAISKVSFAGLTALHYRNQICLVEVNASMPPVVSVTIRGASATVDQAQTQIEQDFAHSIQVRIVSPTKS